MNTVTNITEKIGTLYHPQSALIFYQSKDKNAGMYVEHFDMDSNGIPVNAHPLTVREANALTRALKTNEEKKQNLFKAKGYFTDQHPAHQSE